MEKFVIAVPCNYPFDLLERLWAVDTVERLGIDRHFKEEIKETLDYVYRYHVYWNFEMVQSVFLDHLINIASNLLSPKMMRSHWEERGIGWARENPVPDIDDTVMGLRILRLHGYNVSSGKMMMPMYRTVFSCQVFDSFRLLTSAINILGRCFKDF